MRFNAPFNDAEIRQKTKRELLTEWLDPAPAKMTWEGRMKPQKDKFLGTNCMRNAHRTQFDKMNSTLAERPQANF